VISIYNNQKDLIFLKKNIKSIILKILKKEKVFFDEMAIYFVNKKKISMLHKQFFQDLSATDCISFPIDSIYKKIRPIYLGDIFICPKIAIEYAKKKKLNLNEEIILYLIHAILHLLGYDDKEKKKKEIMKKKENSYMKLIKREKLNILKKYSNL